MLSYMARFKLWQIILVIIVWGLALWTIGCNGTRFLFSTDKQVTATPADLGLKYDEIWFDAADGISIHGWSIPGQADMPLVLFFHGNAANISHFVGRLKYLHKLGFSTFIFDYRGFGKSHGQAMREEDLYIDARGAINYLRSRGWQPSQMVFYGHSMGAAVSLQMGLETSPAAVVLESPFTSIPDIAWPITYALIGSWAIDAEFDNLAKIGNLAVPLVILQGCEDNIVPHKMAQRLYRHAREPKAIYLIPDGGHNDLFQVGGFRYKKAWLELVR